MVWSDDWGIDYTNKRIYNLRAWGLNGSNTVYSVLETYSALMDIFDELDQMDNPIPMTAQTPVEFTLVNQWFIDEESMKYLQGGAIKTLGWDGNIQILTLEEAGYVDCVYSDIGKQVTDDGVEIGALLAYDNTKRKWWIRSTSTVAAASAMAITGGTGAGTAAADSITGENLYANIYTLGTICTDPYAQIYVFQAGERIPEWSYLTNWDRGHIDVVLLVKEAGVEIDGAVITVFARQYGDYYDHYEADLTPGGRTPIPLATATDIDNVTPEYYLLYDGETSPFTVGKILIGATSGAYAEIMAVEDWGTTGLLSLGGVRGDFQDNEAITDTAGGSATVNGTLGDTYLKYDAETAGFTVGETLTGGTSGGKRLIRGIQDDGTTGKLVLQVDLTVTGAARNPYYRAFQDNETITDGAGGSATADGASTTVVSGYSDITIAFVNGTATHGGTTGTFIEGERVTWTGGEGILLKDTGSVITLGNCTTTTLNGLTVTGDISGASCTPTQDLQSAHTMDKAFLKQPAYPYDIIVECGDIYEAGRRVAQVYEYFKFVCRDGSKFPMYTVRDTTITIFDGEEYILAWPGYALKKASPLATFAGGVLFGAQGLWIEGMAVEDVRAYSLIDSNGVKRDPPNLQSCTVTNLVASDRVTVFQTVAGEINKAMFTSHPTNNTAGSTTFEVQEDIPVDTPESGAIRVRRVPELDEQRYTYTSWDGKIFSGLSPVLQYTYDGNDTAYVPFLDEVATGVSESVTVIYVTDRDILVRVRRSLSPDPILPFETTGVFGAAGYTVACIRVPDLIIVV